MGSPATALLSWSRSWLPPQSPTGDPLVFSYPGVRAKPLDYSSCAAAALGRALGSMTVSCRDSSIRRAGRCLQTQKAYSCPDQQVDHPGFTRYIGRFAERAITPVCSERGARSLKSFAL